MTRKILILLFLLLGNIVYAQQSLRKAAPIVPALFEKNIISTGLGERDFALSPDGTEIFYTLQAPRDGVFQTILYMKKNGAGKWSKATIASFAGRYSDIEPAFSPDGNKLFFCSNRPTTGTTIKDFDIWVVEKKNNQWGEAVNLGSPVNTPADEFYPAITKSGNLYFTASYKHAVGKEDIWVAKWENGRYNEAVSLDTTVNSKMFEFNAFVSPEEDVIIFTSYGRKDDKGRGDLYMSIKDGSGKWLPAKNLVFLNSEKIDYCPFVSFDKKTLFFTSERNLLKNAYPVSAVKLQELTQSLTGPQNGFGDIYWVSFDKVIEFIRE